MDVLSIMRIIETSLISLFGKQILSLVTKGEACEEEGIACFLERVLNSLL